MIYCTDKGKTVAVYKHHAMGCRGVEVSIRVCETSAADGGEKLASASNYFSIWEQSLLHPVDCRPRLVLTAGVDAVMNRRNPCFCWDSYPVHTGHSSHDTAKYSGLPYWTDWTKISFTWNLLV
jgi:hypothetical protein